MRTQALDTEEQNSYTSNNNTAKEQGGWNTDLPFQIMPVVIALVIVLLGLLYWLHVIK